MHVVIGRTPDGVALTPFGDEGDQLGDSTVVPQSTLLAEVALRERDHPCWVWDDTVRWYPALLAGGVRVERCVDLRLNHSVLRRSALSAASELATAASGSWDAAAVAPEQRDTALFDFDSVFFGEDGTAADPRSRTPPGIVGAADSETEARGLDRNGAHGPDPIAEFRRQRTAVAESGSAGSLGLLLAAESAGALIAAEMRFAGLPWSSERHDQLLAELLGPRPGHGERPARLEAVLTLVRERLEAPDLNPDSPADLLRALRRAGLMATSTRSWDVKKLDHPAIAPLLEYKKLARLLAANGWQWLDAWVDGGRFRPEYIPGGVVTGRWATSGGGALQLPKQVRGAVIADPGWKLIVADAAQLEPRILAGLSGDSRMAAAGRGDIYEGIVASGAAATRAEAKAAMLGAMYGATSGEAGRLLPRLARAYPRALALVETAARAGERGEVVSTRLGRSSPRPGMEWREVQGGAYGEAADAADQRRAIGQSRSWGRFTRNFIVQGTAAEWALCWMAGLRNRLWQLRDGEFCERPHLVYFLHDELIVHTPADLADEVAGLLRAAAADAGRLLFGAIPLDFPVTVAIVDNYADAR